MRLHTLLRHPGALSVSVHAAVLAAVAGVSVTVDLPRSAEPMQVNLRLESEVRLDSERPLPEPPKLPLDEVVTEEVDGEPFLVDTPALPEADALERPPTRPDACHCQDRVPVNQRVPVKRSATETVAVAGPTVPARTTERSGAPSTPATPAKKTVARRVPPRVIEGQNPRPPYPRRSRQLGEQGVVIVTVTVDVTGTPTGVELKASSGFERLDEAALEAVAEWRFEPAIIGDQVAVGVVDVTVRFQLE